VSFYILFISIISKFFITLYIIFLYNKTHIFLAKGFELCYDVGQKYKLF